MSSNKSRNTNSNARRKGDTRRQATEAKAALPSDHKEAFLPEQTDGWELLKSAKKVRGSDQGRLLAALAMLGLDDLDEGDDFPAEKIGSIADFIDFISERFAKDPEEFDEWSSGEDGFQRAMTLAVTYAGVLGEAVRSKN